jgi:hypothetical protein
MTKDEGMTKREIQNTISVSFDIRAWSLFRHSTFVIESGMPLPPFAHVYTGFGDAKLRLSQSARGGMETANDAKSAISIA